LVSKKACVLAKLSRVGPAPRCFIRDAIYGFFVFTIALR